MDDRLIYREEAYRIIGKGHSEVVYKDALEYEFSINHKRIVL
jgi:hypothetical protein